MSRHGERAARVVDPRIPTPAILGIGTAVPPFSYRQVDLVDWMATAHRFPPAGARALRRIYDRTRIETRHSCLADYGRSAPDFDFFPRNPGLEPPPSTGARLEVYCREAPRLAERACRDLFAGPGMPSPQEVDHVIAVTCTGFSAPGLDVAVVDALGLRPDVGRTVVGFQGCQGGLTALRLADAICRARPGGSVLIVCVELCTLHFRTDPSEENLLANALFSDGAAAVLVGPASLRGHGPAHRDLPHRHLAPPRFPRRDGLVRRRRGVCPAPHRAGAESAGG